LRDGDVVLQVGDLKVTTPEDVLDASFFITAGDPTTIRVSREGKEEIVKIKSARHPLSSSPDATDASDFARTLNLGESPKK